ncbi:MAG TPA: hypothetical protein DDW27_10685 [Bacteroidales bacterium]|nr:hypothetical protein [Bacteroidales bacterium]
MKKLFLLSLLIILSISFANAQTTKTGLNPAGEWKYEAPYAPEEYTTGKITIGIADQKYSAVISLTGSEYKITGQNIKVVNDSLLFSLYIEGETVNVKMKMQDASKMTGVAVSSEGEIPLTATKLVK